MKQDHKTVTFPAYKKENRNNYSSRKSSQTFKVICLYDYLLFFETNKNIVRKQLSFL